MATINVKWFDYSTPGGGLLVGQRTIHIDNSAPDEIYWLLQEVEDMATHSISGEWYFVQRWNEGDQWYMECHAKTD